MAKFSRFDPKNKKKHKHKFNSKDHEGPRIKSTETKRKVKVKFNHTVTNTQFVGKKFAVTYRDKKNNKTSRAIFDYVVVSTVHFSDPYIPE